jgi:hypothetical protein
MEAVIQSGTLWKTANQGIKKGMKNWIPKLRDSHGNMIKDRDEILETTATFIEKFHLNRLTEIEKRELEPDLMTTDKRTAGPITNRLGARFPPNSNRLE